MAALDRLSLSDRLFTFDRRSPIDRFSESDRVSVPDRLSSPRRSPTPDRLSSPPIYVSIGFRQIILRVVIKRIDRAADSGSVAAEPFVNHVFDEEGWDWRCARRSPWSGKMEPIQQSVAIRVPRSCSPSLSRRRAGSLTDRTSASRKRLPSTTKLAGIRPQVRSTAELGVAVATFRPAADT